MRTTTDRLRIRTLAAIGGVLLLVSACSSAGSSAAPAAIVCAIGGPASAPASAGAPRHLLDRYGHRHRRQPI